MKKIDIDGSNIIIYEDGSIRIPHRDMHLCLDFTDISFLYKESKKLSMGVRFKNLKPGIELKCSSSVWNEQFSSLNTQFIKAD